MLIHPDRLFPAEPGTRKIARTLYEHVRTLPIVSPHGHTQAAWFARNEPFPDPARLFVQPDHYIFRMLYSQGVLARGSGDWAAGGEGCAKGLAHLRQSLLSVPRNADADVAGLCLPGAFRPGAATVGRDRRSLLRHDLRKTSDARSSCRALFTSVSIWKCWRRLILRSIRWPITRPSANRTGRRGFYRPSGPTRLSILNLPDLPKILRRSAKRPGRHLDLGGLPERAPWDARYASANSAARQPITGIPPHEPRILPQQKLRNCFVG
jgi:hypothetical protein